MPAGSDALLSAFAERGIEWHPGRMITRLDPNAHEVVFAEGAAMPYDLFLGVPKHVAPVVVTESGPIVDGWIPVNPLTLQTEHVDVFAIGDVASVGTPMAAVFSEGQATVVTDAITARITSETSTRTYDGNGVCYVEFGDRRAGRVDVTFTGGQPPFGHFDIAAKAISTEKEDYRASRLRRWNGADQGRPAPAGGRHDRPRPSSTCGPSS